MAVIVTRNRETWQSGALISAVSFDVDVTDEVVHLDLHDRMRQALAANATYLAIAAPTNAQNTAQVKRLTRECSALIRLLLAVDGARDLLVESTDV